MIEKRLKITLTLKAPFLTQSSEIGAFGIDSPLAATFDGKYCIPRKLIKGCLRQAWTELSEIIDDKPKIKEWLGDKSSHEKSIERQDASDEEIAKSTVEPFRSKLNFEDFINYRPKSEKLITRICIDRDLGSVKNGALQIIEAPFAPNEDVLFEGVIGYFAKDQEEADEIKKHLEIGLRWICNLGALENVNFGQLTNVSIEEDKLPVRNFSDAIGVDHLDLIVKPNAPFCISKKRTASNLFESEEVIPGAVLKGAFVETWKKIAGLKSNEIINENSNVSQKELAENLDKIRFTHAFPAKKETKIRSIKPPLSLVKIIGNNDFFDVASFESPILINGIAPEFGVDWKDKDWNKINTEFGNAELNKQIRVQTEIKNNRAKFNSLYAHEMIVPDGFEWYGRIDLHKIENDAERKIVEQQIRDILSYDLLNIGKTKVSAEIEIADKIKPKFDSNSEPIKDKWIITLQTPAIICNPKELNETSGRKELFSKYKEAWSSLSSRALELSHFYASQSLAGGEYLSKRFQSGKTYNPYLLTDAGSVFVLKLAENKSEKAAQDKISEWCKNGLSLPDWAVADFARNGMEGNHWSNCPYIPENGYGEINVNLPLHLRKKPTEIIDLSEHWHNYTQEDEKDE